MQPSGFQAFRVRHFSDSRQAPRNPFSAVHFWEGSSRPVHLQSIFGRGSGCSPFSGTRLQLENSPVKWTAFQLRPGPRKWTAITQCHSSCGCRVLDVNSRQLCVIKPWSARKPLLSIHARGPSFSIKHLTTTRLLLIMASLAATQSRMPKDHYEPETAVGPAVLGEFGWYDIIVPRSVTQRACFRKGEGFWRPSTYPNHIRSLILVEEFRSRTQQDFNGMHITFLVLLASRLGFLGSCPRLGTYSLLVRKDAAAKCCSSSHNQFVIALP